MNPLRFLQTRQWIIVRRLVLVGLVLFLGYRSYGSVLLSWLQRPDAGRDLVITRSEFRPDIPGSTPSWIIGFKNESRRFTYRAIQFEATYLDERGGVIQTDKLVINRSITPGEETIIGSPDFRERPGAATGRLKVLQAEVVQ